MEWENGKIRKKRKKKWQWTYDGKILSEEDKEGKKR